MKKEEEAGKAAEGLAKPAQKTQERQYEGKHTPEQKGAAEGSRATHKHFVYIGPSVPNGSLARNSIFSGEIGKIEKHLSSVLEKYPKVKNLIVPISQLAAASKEIEKTGNALYRYYEELVAEFRKENGQ